VIFGGDHMLVAAASAVRDGVVPARTFIATTFIARFLSDPELDQLAAEELASLLDITPAVMSAWESALALRGSESEPLRGAIEARARITAEAPVWVRSRPRDAVRFYAVLEHDDAAVAVERAWRRDATAARFRATALIDGPAVQALAGEALVQAVLVEAETLREFRTRAPGVGDDARAD
jgi:hypothetical protein